MLSGPWPRNASRSVVVTWDQPVTGRADVRWTARSRRIRSLVSTVMSLTGCRPARRARSRSCELAVVEGGDRGGQAGRDGVEVAAPACRGAALFFVSGQGQAAAGEEPAQGPPGCAIGWFAAVQELRWAGRGVGCEQPSGLAQDLDRAAWMMACRGEVG